MNSARFEGKNESLANSPVIVGAHQDSVNMWLPMWGRSPGADDDGSGTVTILEVFRALINTGFRPNRPVEFHWYSAEEAGLLGSQAVAQSYEKKGVDVLAMIQVKHMIHLQDFDRHSKNPPLVLSVVSHFVGSHVPT